MSERSRIAVLASGGGSNLAALLAHLDALGGHRAGDVVVVASNSARAGALGRAAARGIAAETFDAGDSGAISALLARHDAELVVLAGYVKLVPPALTRAYRGRIVNVHPSLLPAFGGAGMYGARVPQAVIAAGARVRGATVHFVDEAYDRGPIAAQWPVPVFEEDSAETVASRVLQVEHLLLPRVVDAVAAGTLALDDDGRVRGAFLVGNPGDVFTLARGEAALAPALDAALTR
jgi:formyltetrahydrofolate-dependent phosphoribosylglycinamide formyltransferase